MQFASCPAAFAAHPLHHTHTHSHRERSSTTSRAKKTATSRRQLRCLYTHTHTDTRSATVCCHLQAWRRRLSSSSFTSPPASATLSFLLFDSSRRSLRFFSRSLSPPSPHSARICDFCFCPFFRTVCQFSTKQLKKARVIVIASDATSAAQSATLRYTTRRQCLRQFGFMAFSLLRASRQLRRRLRQRLLLLLYSFGSAARRPFSWPPIRCVRFALLCFARRFSRAVLFDLIFMLANFLLIRFFRCPFMLLLSLWQTGDKAREYPK